MAVTRTYHARDVAVLLQSGNYSGIPVIESGSKLVGVVSEFDLLQALLNRKDLSACTAEEIMTANPVTVEETTMAEVAMQIMIDNQIVRLPVVHNGKLIGVIARSDILNYMIEPNLLNVYGT